MLVSYELSSPVPPPISTISLPPTSTHPFSSFTLRINRKLPKALSTCGTFIVSEFMDNDNIANRVSESKCTLLVYGCQVFEGGTHTLDNRSGICSVWR